MRTRLLHHGYFCNERLAELEWAHGVLFQGLWCLADREGRLEDRPGKIAARLYVLMRWLEQGADPQDRGGQTHAGVIDGLLGELAAEEFIRRYVGPDGTRFIQIVNFLKHQRPHPREAASVIPAEGSAKPLQGQPRLRQDAPDPGSSSALDPGVLDPRVCVPAAAGTVRQRVRTVQPRKKSASPAAPR